MAVALGTTLIDLGIHNLDKEGGWQRIEEGKTTGTDNFIGAAVTRRRETAPNIDLCGEQEAIFGFILGYTQDANNTVDSQGYYYRDYDAPFAAGKWVFIGIPKQGGIYLVLSDTNKTFALDMKLKCVDGVWQEADTNDNFQMQCEQAITGAANTRKYFYAKWVSF
jgi:hypothetical protein